MCHKKVLDLLVLHFLPLIVTTSPGGGDTDFLQTVVDVAACSFPGRNTVAAGTDTVDAVGVALKTTVSAESQIMPF